MKRKPLGVFFSTFLGVVFSCREKSKSSGQGEIFKLGFGGFGQSFSGGGFGYLAFFQVSV
ncbi:MAG: hypothetical protein N2483_11410 [Burkholderiaceae bacterium]|nr:hypothetical protein [Burkholderiaceae bacterium]